jgi:magnesium transporter
MIRILYRPSQEATPVEIPLERLDQAMHDRGGAIWIDFSEEPVENVALILRGTFSFHPLAVDDALTEAHVPKFDDWGEYLYLVLHGVNTSIDSDAGSKLKTEELDIFLGKHYLVTYHANKIEAVDRTYSLVQRDARFFQNSPSYLLYHLSDSLVSDYLSLIDQIDENMTLIEDEVFSNPTQALLEQIFSRKRTLVTLRRILAPQREVLNKLARGDFSAVPESDRVYFRDVYDHVVRLYDIIESMRDLTAGALDIYVSVFSNRMTQVMKTLTIITTLFIPISFLSGFFGMNFFHPVIPLEGWTGLTAFGIVLLLMILTPLMMYLWMRGKAWM